MSFKDDKAYNKPFHSDHNYAIKDCKVKRKYANTYVGHHVHFHDHTYSYKQSYTDQSCQNEISPNKSIDSAHCKTFSQGQPSKDIQKMFDLSCYATEDLHAQKL